MVGAFISKLQPRFGGAFFSLFADIVAGRYGADNAAVRLPDWAVSSPV
jgi:hypothetical protein